jgi:hypothetical protein
MERILLLLLFTGLSLSSPQQEAPAPLEVRFAGPLRWENSCLRGGLDIVNRSAGELFLTRMGPYFYVPLDVSKDESKSGDELEWVNIYGVTDIISMEANALAAGSSVHRDFCFQPTVWVVNLSRNARREIPIRAKLRAEVSYFERESGWRRYKGSPGHEREQLQNSRLWSQAFAEIPCPKETCDSDCNRPPVGVHGEGRMVPDVGEFLQEMNARGKELTRELARKFPTCSGDSSTPHKAAP